MADKRPKPEEIVLKLRQVEVLMGRLSSATVLPGQKPWASTKASLARSITST